MSKPKRTKLSSEEAFGVDVDHVSVHIGEIPPRPARPAPPGVIRYISTEAVEQGIYNFLNCSLLPVVLEPTKGYTSLRDALTNSSNLDNDHASCSSATSKAASLNASPSPSTGAKADPLAFSSISKRVHAVIQSQLKPAPIAACFDPLLLSVDVKLNISSAFMEQFTMLIGSVIDVVKEHTERWTEIDQHKENFDQELLVKVCSKILWINSVVFKECVIDNKFLPHGTVDIVCGCLGKDDISIKLGVVVDKGTPTLKTRELNPQIVVEGLSFGEVISNPSKEPYILLGATREAFRVFIRLGGRDDILLTTTGVIQWWMDGKPNIEGICALVFVILCAGGVSKNSPVLSAQNIERLTKRNKYVATGWTQFYEHCGRQYEDFVITSGSTAKFENTRKRLAAMERVPIDEVSETLHDLLEQ